MYNIVYAYTCIQNVKVPQWSSGSVTECPQDDLHAKGNAGCSKWKPKATVSYNYTSAHARVYCIRIIMTYLCTLQSTTCAAYLNRNFERSQSSSRIQPWCGRLFLTNPGLTCMNFRVNEVNLAN